MRIMFFAMGLIAALPITASAEESVDGYDRQDGTYVEPYVRTDPNDTPTDNYSKRAVRRRVGRFWGQTRVPNSMPTVRANFLRERRRIGRSLRRSECTARQGSQLAEVGSGEGYFVILRLYSPTEAYLNLSWKPSDLEEMN